MPLAISDLHTLPPEVADLATWNQLTAAARAFTMCPAGDAWDALERAAVVRAIHRLRETGERIGGAENAMILLAQLAEEE